MRQFKLMNANGQTFDLMRKDAFFHAPAGLGWGLDVESMRAGDTYVVTNRKPQKPTPSGEIVFAGYAQYDEFMAFAQVGGLVLAYRPRDTWQYLDVDLSIEKGEIAAESKRLVCAVSFTASSQWYEQIKAYQAQQEKGDGKVYSYTYPYTYKSAAAGAVEIANGNLSSYPKLTIFGPVEDPTWALYQYGKRLSVGTVNITIPQGNKLVVDMHPATMQIAEYTENGLFVADRYQNSDFTTERIFELPPGDCQIVFTQNGIGAVRAFVEVRKRV